MQTVVTYENRAMCPHVYDIGVCLGQAAGEGVLWRLIQRCGPLQRHPFRINWSDFADDPAAPPSIALAIDPRCAIGDRLPRGVATEVFDLSGLTAVTIALKGGFPGPACRPLNFVSYEKKHWR